MLYISSRIGPSDQKPHTELKKKAVNIACTKISPLVCLRYSKQHSRFSQRVSERNIVNNLKCIYAREWRKYVKRKTGRSRTTKS